MFKKKVGIVTFHTADNYGAVLQGYALQEYIKKNFNYDVSIIDFCTAEHLLDNALFRKYPVGFVRNIVYNFCTLLHYFSLKKRSEKFLLFRTQYLNLTLHKYTTSEDFLSNIEFFDYYISGSDQVFNPKVRFSDCYYLAFKKNKSKKVAYAPSFGVISFSDEEKKRIKRFCSDFDSLSCREQQGSNFMSDLMTKKIPTVCDPVFLLSKNDWNSIIISSSEVEPYLLVYDLNGGYPLLELAKKVSAANGGMNIVCVTTKTRVCYKGVKVLRNVGPCELLGLIAKSQFVVTDSFHGTSLSLIFEKKVLSYIAFPQTSSRIISVLRSLGLDDQIVTNLSDFDFQKIQFNNYREKLISFVSSSKQYLLTSLTN